MNDDRSQNLSPIGMQRREAMLHELTRGMVQLHRCRRIRRRAVVAGAPILVIGAIALVWMSARGPQNTQPDPTIAHNPPPVRPAVVIVMVKTDPAIVDRYRVTPTPQAAEVQVLDDDGLLAALVEINRPAGLIRTAGRVWLTSDVTDPPTGADGS